MKRRLGNIGAIIIVVALVLCVPNSASAWDDPIQFGVPPQLDETQTFRWKQAYPAARPRLAQLYGIPQEIAEQYGAKYTCPIKETSRLFVVYGGGYPVVMLDAEGNPHVWLPCGR